MRVVVIGGSGHIGTFLIPRLVRAGHDVVAISRGQRSSYVDDPSWQQVQQIVADRVAEDADGTFAGRVADLRPDAVVDLICFTLESARALVDGLRGRTGHYVYCGSIWRHGPSVRLPITESNGAPPIGEYGIEKAATVALLKEETACGGLITTSLHPGHIVGPGWHPINPLGNIDPSVWRRLSAGEPLEVPGIGSEFMHHVHADDVAQAFAAALDHREAAAGEDVNIVAPTALNVRGYAAIAASWFGQTADLRSRHLGRLPSHHQRGRLRLQLGSPAAQPLRQHREGSDAARVRAGIRARRGRPGIGAVADRARRAGRR